MPSRLLYHEPRFGGEKPRNIDFGYVVGPARDVLRQTYMGHRIHRYGNIELPIETDTRDEPGLIIRQTSAPRGTVVVAYFDPLERKLAARTHPRDCLMQDMQNAFRQTIYESAQYSDGNDVYSYVSAVALASSISSTPESTLLHSASPLTSDVDEKQHRRLTRNIQSLLDIAEVVFAIQNPTCADLDKILEHNRWPQMQRTA